MRVNTEGAIGTDSMYVGDLHGRVRPLELAIEKFEQEGLDKLVFLGDYVDSYDVTNAEILYVLDQVIKYKKEHPDKVVCLIGNHDMQYMFSDPAYRCSGYRSEIQHEIQWRFMEGRNLFQVADLNGKFLATHAGLLNSWYEKYYDRLKYYQERIGFKDDMEFWPKIDIILNTIFETHDRWILNTVGTRRGGVYGSVGGITWADSTEIGLGGCIPKFDHIVGHNRVDDIKVVKQKAGNLIMFTDCLSKMDDFLILKK